MLEAVAEFLAQGGIEVVGRAGDGEEALELIERLLPQVALIDVRMPKLGGVELTRRARTSAPSTAVLLYTGYGDRALLSEGLDAGVTGFVLKEAPIDDLLRAVESVAAGGTYIDPVLATPSPARRPGPSASISLVANATSCDCSPTVCRTRRSATSSSSLRRRFARMCERRWSSSVRTRGHRRLPVRCVTS